MCCLLCSRSAPLHLLALSLIASAFYVFVSILLFNPGLFHHAHEIFHHPSASRALIIIFDSSALRLGSDHKDLALGWVSGSAVVIKHCRDKTCGIHLVFHEDDREFGDVNFQREVIARVNQAVTLKWSFIWARRSYVKIHRVAKEAKDAHKLSRIVGEAYLLNAEYFWVILSAQFERGFMLQGELQRMEEALYKANPSNIGLALLVSVADSETIGVSLDGVLVSRIHVDIFGDFLSHQIQDLKTALGYLVSLYEEHRVSWIRKGGALQTKNISWRVDEIWAKEVMVDASRTLTRYLRAVWAKPCLRCNLQLSRRVIAMSLHSPSPSHTTGALRNAQLLPVVFPGWRLWFYVKRTRSNSPKLFYDGLPPRIVAKIQQLGAEIHYVDPTQTGLAPALQHFHVVDQHHLDAFIVRDTDTRLIPRDAAAVADWLRTDMPFHCIRDHPDHTRYPVNAGLWGGRPARLKEILNVTLKMKMSQNETGSVEDRHSVISRIWPVVGQAHAVCHDSFSCDNYTSSKAFPSDRDGYQFVGQVYNEHSMGRDSDVDALRKTAPNPLCARV